MTYEELLAGAPAHDTPEFINYLRENNKVVLDCPQWLVIENAKYHTEEKPWYTAFHIPRLGRYLGGGAYIVEWYEDADILYWNDNWATWEWLKKDLEKQTVKRFHIHIHK